MKRIESDLHSRVLAAILVLLLITIFISFSMEINAYLQKNHVQQEESLQDAQMNAVEKESVR